MKVRKKNIVDKMLLQNLNRGYVYGAAAKNGVTLFPHGCGTERNGMVAK